LKKNSRTMFLVAGSMIWLLQILGIMIHIFAIPVVSESLSKEFVEYSGDGPAIQLLLSGLVATGQIALAIVWVLLRRVTKQTLLVKSSSTWVLALAGTAFGLAAIFLALMIWLILQNTLPPFASAGLLTGILISSIVGLVTASLNGVLKDATEARFELESVI